MGVLNEKRCKTAVEAKRKGGKKGLLLHPIELEQWNEISISVQREICRWKFEHYEEVRNDLIKSENKILIHPAIRCSEEKLEKYKIWEGRAIIHHFALKMRNVTLPFHSNLPILWAD